MKKTREPVTASATQMNLPFDPEGIAIGWRGKRYLLCSDGVWHLVLEIREGLVADTQCCENVKVVLPRPDAPEALPPCNICATLQYAQPKR